jgi:hypothetical protein
MENVEMTDEMVVILTPTVKDQYKTRAVVELLTNLSEEELDELLNSFRDEKRAGWNTLDF